MANVIFASAMKAIPDADIDLLVDTIKVALIDTATTPFSAGYDFYNDVSAGVVGTPATLASKTTTNGKFDSADPVWTAVSGEEVRALLMFKDTTVAGTSPVIGWWDENIAGLPLTPNGGNVTYVVHANGWFGL